MLVNERFGGGLYDRGLGVGGWGWWTGGGGVMAGNPGCWWRVGNQSHVSPMYHDQHVGGQHVAPSCLTSALTPRVQRMRGDRTFRCPWPPCPTRI